MNEPTNTEPTISYNDPDIDQECSELARAIAPIVLNELISGKPHEDTAHGRALVAAVYRACDDLEGQGARSDRIALQLLEALARYEYAVETLAQDETEQEPVPLYRIEWCMWEYGGDEEHQEWKNTDGEGIEDEYSATEMCKRLNIEYAPRMRHRVVQVKP